MGASERDKRDERRPLHVWIDHSGHWTGDAWPGILVEWRQITDRRGRTRWEALVARAHGGGEVAWSISFAWVHEDYVRPAYPQPPPRGWPSPRTRTSADRAPPARHDQPSRRR